MAIFEDDSAGQVVSNAQTARDDRAITQNPETTADSTNRRLTDAGIVLQDTGLDPPTIPLSRSQATPAQVDSPGPQAPTQPGVGARGDDATTITNNTTRDIINLTYSSNNNRLIYPRPNVLDDYASYTYQISWYLLSQNQYNALINSSRRSVGAWSLLMQSGGIPVNSALPDGAGSTGTNSFSARNQQFPVDYYLDDLEIHSLFPFGGTRMAHCATSIKFKVVEPNGLTLIDNLYRAVEQVYGEGANSPDFVGPPAYLAADNLPPTATNSRLHTPNYIQAHYCLTIKFYGYDEEGNLQAPLRGKYTVSNTPDFVGPPADVNAIVTKIYPFVLSNITFSMAPGANSRGIEYHVEGIPTGQAAGFAQSRGTIPFNFQLSGATIGDLLTGGTAQSSLQIQPDGRVPASTPPSANIPPTPVARVGATGQF